MKEIKVIKRNGKKVDFDASKIRTAIGKANAEVPPVEQMSDVQMDAATEMVVKSIFDAGHDIGIEDIQEMVILAIQRLGAFRVATVYTEYRYKRQLARHQNTTDEDILKLIGGANKEMAEENANKDTTLASTQRDYIAGIVSRDVTSRLLLPEHISKAHQEGLLHFHDADYFIQPIFNCCLINLGDMLENGIVVNGKMIETPKSFQVACTVTTQIISCVASNQYGGQSVDVCHLGKYLRYSRDKYRRKILAALGDAELNSDAVERLVDERVHTELSSGIQTIQYQLNTLMTTNGQSPFVTLFLYLRDDDPYIEENALIIEEILKQRIQGIKNDVGVYITPAFPKLVYVLDENNCLKGGKYDYLTELAARCSAKRMYPDYISAKKMRENYEGNVFSPMGCVDGDEVVSYKWMGHLYTESFSRMWNRLSDVYAVQEQRSGDPDYLYMDTPDGVEIFDTKEGFVKNHRIIRNKAKNWMRVTFSNGRVLTCTDDHPFETENRGIVYAKDLTPNDMIRIEHSAPAGTSLHYNRDKAWLFGFMLCDSAYYESIAISIAKHGEDDIQERITKYVKALYGLDVSVVERERGSKGRYKDLILRPDATDTHAQLRVELTSLFGGIKKSVRHIPNEVFSFDQEGRIAFLAGLIDADGYINNHSRMPKIQIGSTNKELAIQEMLLAQSLGMRASMYLNRYRQNKKDAIRYSVEFYPTAELVDALACEKKKAHYSNVARKNASIVESKFCFLSKVEQLDTEMYSYDVTTSSGHFTVSGIYSHNCRSFLSPWKDEDGNYKFEGRFNQGVVSINLPQIGLAVHGDMEQFWPEFDRRLEICKEAILCRHKALLGVTSDISPIHWQYGAIARLRKGEKIDKYLFGGYSSISLGYIGLYELTYLMTGKSQTQPGGTEFALQVMHHLKDAVDRWKKETNIGFALYGTPAESLCYRFARIDQEKYGIVKNVTDKGYYTNSYHVDVREKIDAFSKLSFESQFQSISTGGCISYVELPNMQQNLDAVKTLIRFIYDNIQYAEFNTKNDYCQVCGYSGEIQTVDGPDGNPVWECPCCGNRDQHKMNVVRRTCGYLGEKFWNVGKTKEIRSRVLHL